MPTCADCDLFQAVARRRKTCGRGSRRRRGQRIEPDDTGGLCRPQGQRRSDVPAAGCHGRQGARAGPVTTGRTLLVQDQPASGSVRRSVVTQMTRATFCVGLSNMCGTMLGKRKLSPASSTMGLVVEPQPQAAGQDIAGLFAGVLEEVGARRAAGIERELVEFEIAFALRRQRFLDDAAGGEPQQPPARSCARCSAAVAGVGGSRRNRRSARRARCSADAACVSTAWRARVRAG